MELSRIDDVVTVSTRIFILINSVPRPLGSKFRAYFSEVRVDFGKYDIFTGLSSSVSKHKEQAGGRV